MTLDPRNRGAQDGAGIAGFSRVAFFARAQGWPALRNGRRLGGGAIGSSFARAET